MGYIIITSEFWLPFQRSDDGAKSDWDAGDFHLENVCDTEGTWSGWARDVHFDRIDLPATWLAQEGAAPSALSANGALSEDDVTTSNGLKGALPPSATNSDRLHLEAADAAAQLVRKTRCTLADAIRQVRDLAPEKNRTEHSIDRAVRQSYNLIYDRHGMPIKI